jgi:CMP-N-acetylneuraminic acid synthetase
MSLLLTDVIVSTDSIRIQEVCETLGAKVPFLRPALLAQDDTPDKPVLRHAILWYEDANAITIDAVAILRPTTPFKTGKLIDEAIELLVEKGADSVRSMTLTEGIYHPYWMFRKSNSENRALPLIEGKSIEEYYQSQLLPHVYHLNGVIDVIRRDVVMRKDGFLYGDDMRILDTPVELSYDIDTETDLEFCEFIISRQKIT